MLRRLPFKRVSSIMEKLPLTPLIGVPTEIDSPTSTDGNDRKVRRQLKCQIRAPMRWENATPIAR